MFVRYTPQRSDHDIGYVFDGERIIATVNGNVEEYDLSTMPEGRMTGVPDSVLNPRPLLSAERKDGELTVTLLKPIGPRPQPVDYETPEEFAAAREAWKAEWQVTEEVVG